MANITMCTSLMAETIFVMAEIVCGPAGLMAEMILLWRKTIRDPKSSGGNSSTW
jgi:hypothetical protein